MMITERNNDIHNNINRHNIASLKLFSPCEWVNKQSGKTLITSKAQDRHDFGTNLVNAMSESNWHIIGLILLASSQKRDIIRFIPIPSNLNWFYNSMYCSISGFHQTNKCKSKAWPQTVQIKTLTVVRIRVGRSFLVCCDQLSRDKLHTPVLNNEYLLSARRY